MSFADNDEGSGVIGCRQAAVALPQITEVFQRFSQHKYRRTAIRGWGELVPHLSVLEPR